jgi:enoyl-CoA hydratase/carnithine racemase
LFGAVSAVGADGSAAAAVFIGAGRNFVAGDDIRDFGTPLADLRPPT